MNLLELSKYLLDEEAAEEYLVQKGILKNFCECPFCSSKTIGNIRRGLLKCYRCKKEWNRRKHSFLESKHITNSKFIGFMKLYSNEMGVILICNELEIDRKHGVILFNDLRKVLFSNMPRFNDKSEKVILWADKQNILKIQFVESKYVPPEAKGYLELSFNRYKEYGGLYSFLINSDWKGRKIRYNNLINNFISFIKMKAISYRGIHKKYFFEYLTEQVIRFNFRSQKFYKILLENLHFSRVVKTPLSRNS